MVRAAKTKRATIADLEKLPATVVGEVIDGVLHTQPRPTAFHVSAGSVLTGQLSGPFQLGRGGPGGWWILAEPGVRLDPDEEVSPDLGGWTVERLPEIPSDGIIRIAPDWVCEILSPGTRAYDLRVKPGYYARHGVKWMWLVDREAQSLLVHRLVGTQWLVVGNFGGDEKVRAEPFEAITIDLKYWWSGPVKAKKRPAPRRKKK